MHGLAQMLQIPSLVFAGLGGFACLHQYMFLHRLAQMLQNLLPCKDHKLEQLSVPKLQSQWLIEAQRLCQLCVTCDGG